MTSYKTFIVKFLTVKGVKSVEVKADTWKVSKSSILYFYRGERSVEYFSLHNVLGWKEKGFSVPAAEPFSARPEPLKPSSVGTPIISWNPFKKRD